MGLRRNHRLDMSLESGAAAYLPCVDDERTDYNGHIQRAAPDVSRCVDSLVLGDFRDRPFYQTLIIDATSHQALWHVQHRVNVHHRSVMSDAVLSRPVCVNSEAWANNPVSSPIKRVNPGLCPLFSVLHFTSPSWPASPFRTIPPRPTDYTPHNPIANCVRHCWACGHNFPRLCNSLPSLLTI